jgi:hypothetical protein
MKSRVLICAALIFAIDALADMKTKEGTTKQAKQTKGETQADELSKSAVDSECGKYSELVMAQKWNYAQITEAQGAFQRYAEHPGIEKKTKISKDWYLKLAKITQALANNYVNLDAAVADNLPAARKKCEQEKTKIMAAFKETYDNPTRLK